VKNLLALENIKILVFRLIQKRTAPFTLIQKYILRKIALPCYGKIMGEMTKAKIWVYVYI